jgi:ATP/maltotriose-dependent transcriptional regulator MalT
MRVIRVAVLDSGSEWVERVVKILRDAGAEVVVREPDVETLIESSSQAGPDVVIIDASARKATVHRVRTRTDAPAGAPSPLSPEETDILRLVSAGLHVAMIARTLELSAQTVRAHLN